MTVIFNLWKKQKLNGTPHKLNVLKPKSKQLYYYNELT